jgi:hypothetical protein
MAAASSAPSTHTWHRVRSRLKPGTPVETFGGTDRAVADDRVVDFSHRSGDLLLPAFTSSYAPLQVPGLLGDFLYIFAPPHVPTDEEILTFYGESGPIRDDGWRERLLAADVAELPEAALLGLREPVWYLRELATELQICCTLYSGIAENRPDLLREVLGRAPSSGVLVQVMLLAGELHKPWASEADRRQRVGSFGQWEPSAEDPGREFTAEECFDLARALLSGKLNEYEAKAHRRWVRRTQQPSAELGRRTRRAKETEENPILTGTRTVVFSSLITALYLQLSDAAERGRLLRRCRGCERFFWPDRPNQDYCKTRCANSYRRRQFTRRRAGDAGPSRQSAAGPGE